MYLLDTNVVSELRKARTGGADSGLAAWADTVPLPAMFLSAISLHELEYGVLLAERTDAAKASVLREWLDASVLPAFHGRVVPVDGEVAVRAAQFHVPDPAPFRDALIGASARVHSMTVVTRNADDFARFDIDVLNPWSN